MRSFVSNPTPAVVSWFLRQDSFSVTRKSQPFPGPPKTTPSLLPLPRRHLTRILESGGVMVFAPGTISS